MAHILIVEDEPDIAEGLASLLQAEGHAVTQAPDGEAALQAMRRGLVPDLIVLDLTMPVMDGYEFRRHQLEDPRFDQVPVIVLTANTRVRDRHALKAHAILTKPVDFGVLCEGINAALSTRTVAP